MAAVRILLGIVWLVVISSSWRNDSGFIGDGTIQQGRDVVAIAQNEIGVQECNQNSSPRIDQYNAYVGFRKVPWCASFVSWVFGQAGYQEPKTAWSPALFPANRLTKNPMPGAVMGIYFNQLKRIGHCGIVTEVRGSWVISVEGNTSLNGSREGDGVYRRMRHKRSIRSFSEWGTN